MPEDPTIFVVDDETSISSSLAMILNCSGFRATSFTTGRTALEQADKHPPSLLIADVSMPEMSGIELAIQFKTTCPECKVLLFSGHTATSELSTTASGEGHGFKILTKPIHPLDLIAALRKLWESVDSPACIPLAI